MPEDTEQVSLEALVHALAGSAFVEPEEGATMFAFLTRETARTLEPAEVLGRFGDGRGVFLVELVYDEELNLLERGEGRVVRGRDDLLGIARKRFPELRLSGGDDGFGGAAPGAGLARSAPLAAEDGMPEKTASIPWHPSSIPLPTRDD